MYCHLLVNQLVISLGSEPAAVALYISLANMLTLVACLF